MDDICPNCQYAHNGHRCPAELLGEQFERNVTIRAIIKDGSIQLLVYTPGTTLGVEFVDVPTTSDVNECWHAPVLSEGFDG